MIGAVRFILRMIIKNGSTMEAAEAEEGVIFAVLGSSGHLRRSR